MRFFTKNFVRTRRMTTFATQIALKEAIGPLREGFIYPLTLLNMNKTDLTNAIAAQAGLTKADAKKALDATLNAISAALKGGDKVALVGFGTFSVAERPARTGVNPLNKKPITIPAKKVAKFKSGKELDDAIQ